MPGSQIIERFAAFAEADMVRLTGRSVLFLALLLGWLAFR